ncbi:HNH endonuclease [Gottfriedia sp. NPDC056225]|uniref:HNH endonuclease n=1 Tax=Gottfriedia sp. NPDC056225 TaxID=3345751 RepID=UPI0035DCB0D2
MANKPLRPCNKYSCSNLTRNSYCDEHRYIKKQQDMQRAKRYDQYKRDQRSKSFYDSTLWKKVRDLVMRRDLGLCQQCKREDKITLADVVDHIIPIKKRWDLRLDKDNLQALCHKCHNKKTIDDKKDGY